LTEGGGGGGGGGGDSDGGVALDRDGGTGPGPALDAASALDAADAEVRRPFVFRDNNHVLGTGQSLSIGAAGSPVLSTTQPYANVMFNTGAIAGGTGLTTFIPLVEGFSTGSVSGLETHSSAFANLITKLAREQVFVTQPPATQSHDVLVSGHGVGGIAYVGLKKGTTAYANGMAQVSAAKALAESLGKSYVVRAITNVHGESDHIALNARYDQDLEEWQSSYDTDVKAITGQIDPIVMLHTQMSSWTKFGQATSAIPIAQLAASVAHPDTILLVGPKYHLPYAADGVHLTNEGYRHMGEDYAKVYRRVILEGLSWQPLRPISITRAGVVITVKFAVPTPPLVLDGETISNPGDQGFEYTDDGDQTPDIANVAITGPDTVTIILTSVPNGPGKRLRYAFTGDVNAAGGPDTGPRGTLRDSDDTPSRNGYSLFNWCVHFDEAVP
jgi:hypothetical protein